MLVISCHADTGFASHRLARVGDLYRGHLDNFAGVYVVMRAYFSGELPPDGVRIELTEGEEIDMAGARRVAATLDADDLVVVVDVTGAPTTARFTIEKCREPELQRLLGAALGGLDYELHRDCPDPISDSDESDVYGEVCAATCFLGIPVTGGDYNQGEVVCREESLATAAEALVRIARAYVARRRVDLG
jgi:hypothetical protein